jgi:hypothetical protein
MAGALAGVGSGAADGCEGMLDATTLGAEEVAVVLSAPASLLRCAAGLAWPPPASSA